MAHAKIAIGRWAVKKQTGWGTPETSFASTDVIECEAAIPESLMQEALQPDVLKGGFFEAPMMAGSQEPTEITLRMPMHGFSASSPSANVAVVTPEMLLLAHLLSGGSLSAKGYNEALDGGSATTVVTTSGAADDVVGHALNVPLVGGGRGTCWVTDRATGTYTVGRLPAAPAATGTIIGSQVAWLNEVTQADALTLEYVGDRADLKVRLWDAIPVSAKITLTAKKQPQLEVTVRAASWTRLTEGGGVSVLAYPYPQLPAILGGSAAWAMLGDKVLCVRESVISFTAEVEAIDCWSAGQGVAAFEVTNRQVTAELKYHHPDGLGTLLAPGAEVGNGGLQLVPSSSPGRGWAFLLATPMVRESENLLALGQVVGRRLLLGARPRSDGGTVVAPPPPASTTTRCAWT